MMRMSQVETSFFPFKNGLDLVSPAIEIDPGRCIDSQNYTTAISGGYERLTGYERFDGHASPSTANYWLMPITKTVNFLVGQTLTGLTSGATCKVLQLTSDIDGSIVTGRVVGTFVAGESLSNGAIVGTLTSSVLQNSAINLSDDADYTLLAANDLRGDISAPPGSGRIRGIWMYGDAWYCFRDNAAGTTGNMWKATASGWTQVALGTEIQFTGAVGQITAGQTISGASSGAAANVVVAMLRTGTWTSAGAGTLILTSIVGTFQNGEALQVGAVTKVTSASLATPIARAPGGSMEFCNFNFTGSTLTLKMYGCDGVNLAFEFDGTTYVPIRTGMTNDTPSHIVGYKTYLFLSFLGSVQLSALGSPYSWSTVLGAAEITTGDAVTGFLPQVGTGSASSLAIFTKLRTFILYGDVTANFALKNSVWDIGYSAFTIQPVSNNTYGITARGIQSLLTTLNYGDFEYASISHEVQPLINAKRGLEISSTAIKSKNQYRVYFSDGTGIAVGLTGDKVNGLMYLNYGTTVRCICTATMSNGSEVTMFGDDNGNVYQDNIGTSFDGAAIEHWLRLSFNHLKSPRRRKRMRRMVIEGTVERYCELRVTYDLDYGSSDVSPSAVMPAQSLAGGGAYWDSNNMVWDQFTWDVQSVINPSISLDGTATNISFLFYGSRNQDKPHVLQGQTIHYSNRRDAR